MKILVSIIVGSSILLAGLTPLFGFGLPVGGQAQFVNRWAYSFGDRYNYDNTGSRWNYDNGRRNYHDNLRRGKYWLPRFEYNNRRTLNENEQFQDLIEHLSGQHCHHLNPCLHDRFRFSNQNSGDRRSTKCRRDVQPDSRF